MSKRKENRFIDILTILLIVLPFICLALTVWQSGNLDVNIGEYVSKFAISDDLSQKIGECINTFGIAFNGQFFAVACTIMANALLIYIFRLFVAVMVFVPKMASKFLNLGGD